MASSSSSSLSEANIQEKYDVFLSFRGEDTRGNFTSHLYGALCNKHIQTFFDQDGLQRGEYISPTLFKAIEESKILVVIFSQNYASSTWCLEELVKILKCKKRNNRMVIPVFYHVSPSDVRKQTGSIGDAFFKHEQMQIPKEQVQRWKDALTEASNLSGLDSTNFRSEFKLVKQIVDNILEILMGNMSPSSYCKFLVGMEEHVAQIKSLLSKHQGIVIWGMGGIGKTTIAEVVYQQISFQFEGCSFIPNVREEVEKQGLVRLKEHLLAKILDDKKLTLDTLNTIPQLIQERLKCKKVLLVLDDVYDKRHFQSLIGGLEFGLGSKVIITTRNKELYHAYEESVIYQIDGLKYRHAFELFCHHAFKQNPTIEYLGKLSEEIVYHVRGHPLSLEVLGSPLYGKNEKDWESMLQSLLKGDSNHEIFDTLRISYNRLDDEEKEIFLDIACFFKGWDYDHVTKILNSCYNGPIHRLSFLIDKSLISKTNNNAIQMHDVLQEMGWNITRQESPRELGNRSRLWDEDAFQVLKNNTGTHAVQGLFLDSSKIIDIDLSPDAFQKMPNLKFLNFYIPPFENSVNFSCSKLKKKKLEKLTHLSNELRCLHWYGCPLKELPSTFSPENLVELTLPYGKLKKLWKGKKNLPKLLLIDLHDSEWLIEIPDLSDAEKLEAINLQNCKSLKSFRSSGQYNPKLHFLGLEKFLRVKSIPPTICKFKSLVKLNLSGCSNLKSSEDLCCISSLEVLDLSRTNIGSLNFKQLLRLRILYLNYCHMLQSLPDLPPNLELLKASYCKQLRSLSVKHAPTLRLKSIDLSYSSCLTCIPDLSNATELEDINLFKCKSLGDISSSIQGLDNLRSLILAFCDSLQGFSNHVHFKSLDELNLICCQNLSEFPNVSGSIKTLLLNFAPIKEVPLSIGCIENLRLIDCENPWSSSRINLSHHTNLLSGPANLDLNDCKNLENIPRSVSDCQNRLKQIRKLYLGSCKLTEIPENLCFLSSLEILDLKYNNFKSLPASIKQLSQLKFLYLNECHMLQSLPELPLHLRVLEAVNCNQLQSLPELPLNDFKEVDDAYELKIEESRHYKLFSKNDIRFLFTNCPKLGGNASIQFLANAPLRFQYMVATSLEYRHQDMEWDGIPRIKFCLPGSEIPNWVSYQSLGSSFSIDLSQDWFNKNFIGFALCAVIQFEEGYHVNGLYVVCEYNFETNCGDKVKFISGLRVANGSDDMGEFIERDHAVIMYHPCFDAKLRQDEHTTASFEFRPVPGIWNGREQEFLKACKVKCCGAHPLYSRPSEAQPSFRTKASATTCQRNKSGSEEETERNSGGTVNQTRTNGNKSGTCDGEETAVAQPSQVSAISDSKTNRSRNSIFNEEERADFFCKLGALWLLERCGLIR